MKRKYFLHLDRIDVAISPVAWELEALAVVGWYQDYRRVFFNESEALTMDSWCDVFSLRLEYDTKEYHASRTWAYHRCNSILRTARAELMRLDKTKWFWCLYETPEFEFNSLLRRAGALMCHWDYEGDTGADPLFSLKEYVCKYRIPKVWRDLS